MTLQERKTMTPRPGAETAQPSPEQAASAYLIAVRTANLIPHIHNIDAAHDLLVKSFRERESALEAERDALRAAILDAIPENDPMPKERALRSMALSAKEPDRG